MAQPIDKDKPGMYKLTPIGDRLLVIRAPGKYVYDEETKQWFDPDTNIAVPLNLVEERPEAEVKAIVADLERRIFLRGAWKVFGLGAGPCYFCKVCSVEDGRCKHPDRARPAMEACGIDVFSTVKKAGFPLDVV